MDDSRFNLDRLLELARKATPGPWFWPYVNTLAADPKRDPDSEWTLIAGLATDISAEDATFIEVANPDTIIELIERVKEAERQRTTITDKTFPRRVRDEHIKNLESKLRAAEIAAEAAVEVVEAAKDAFHIDDPLLVDALRHYDEAVGRVKE